MQLEIHTDGGARGNPGPAAIGVVISEKGIEIYGYGTVIGQTTNNVAEYSAVISALEKMEEWKKEGKQVEHCAFYLDSLLVVNQLKGIYKIKEPHLQQLAIRAQGLIRSLGVPITFTAVRREENKQADMYVNQALDAQK